MHENSRIESTRGSSSNNNYNGAINYRASRSCDRNPVQNTGIFGLLDILSRRRSAMSHSRRYSYMDDHSVHGLHSTGRMLPETRAVPRNNEPIMTCVVPGREFNQGYYCDKDSDTCCGNVSRYPIRYSLTNQDSYNISCCEGDNCCAVGNRVSAVHFNRREMNLNRHPRVPELESHCVGRENIRSTNYTEYLPSLSYDDYYSNNHHHHHRSNHHDHYECNCHRSYSGPIRSASPSVHTRSFSANQKTTQNILTNQKPDNSFYQHPTNVLTNHMIADNFNGHRILLPKRRSRDEADLEKEAKFMSAFSCNRASVESGYYNNPENTYCDIFAVESNREMESRESENTFYRTSSPTPSPRGQDSNRRSVIVQLEDSELESAEPFPFLVNPSCQRNVENNNGKERDDTGPGESNAEHLKRMSRLMEELVSVQKRKEVGGVERVEVRRASQVSSDVDSGRGSVERCSIPKDLAVNTAMANQHISDGADYCSSLTHSEDQEFGAVEVDSGAYFEIEGLSDDSDEQNKEGDKTDVKQNTSESSPKSPKVKFSCAPIRVYETHSVDDYNRHNEDIDPVTSSAVYELEKRMEKMEIFQVELIRGESGIGLNVVGVGMGASNPEDERLGIFIKSLTPGGVADKDGRLSEGDLIIEVNGESLLGVTTTISSSILRKAVSPIRLLVGRDRKEMSEENSKENADASYSLIEEYENLVKLSVTEDNDENKNAAEVKSEQKIRNVLESVSSDEVSLEDIQSLKDMFEALDSEDLAISELDSQLLFVKLKESQFLLAGTHAEVTKLKAKLMRLEGIEEQKLIYERKCEDMAARLRTADRSILLLQTEINTFQAQCTENERLLRGGLNQFEKKYSKAKKLIREYQQRERQHAMELEVLRRQQRERDLLAQRIISSLRNKLMREDADSDDVRALRHYSSDSDQSHSSRGTVSFELIPPKTFQMISLDSSLLGTTESLENNSHNGIASEFVDELNRQTSVASSQQTDTECQKNLNDTSIDPEELVDKALELDAALSSDELDQSDTFCSNDGKETIRRHPLYGKSSAGIVKSKSCNITHTRPYTNVTSLTKSGTTHSFPVTCANSSATFSNESPKLYTSSSANSSRKLSTCSDTSYLKSSAASPNNSRSSKQSKDGSNSSLVQETVSSLTSLEHNILKFFKSDDKEELSINNQNYQSNSTSQCMNNLTGTYNCSEKYNLPPTTSNEYQYRTMPTLCSQSICNARRNQSLGNKNVPNFKENLVGFPNRIYRDSAASMQTSVGSCNSMLDSNIPTTTTVDIGGNGKHQRIYYGNFVRLSRSGTENDIQSLVKAKSNESTVDPKLIRSQMASSMSLNSQEFIQESTDKRHGVSPLGIQADNNGAMSPSQDPLSNVVMRSGEWNKVQPSSSKQGEVSFEQIVDIKATRNRRSFSFLAAMSGEKEDQDVKGSRSNLEKGPSTRIRRSEPIIMRSNKILEQIKDKDADTEKEKEEKTMKTKTIYKSEPALSSAVKAAGSSKPSSSIKEKAATGCWPSSCSSSSPRNSYCQMIGWTPQQMAEWIATLNLKADSQIFEQRGVGGQEFLNLDTRKMKDIGIKASKDRDVLSKIIGDVKASLEREKKRVESEKKEKQRQNSSGSGKKFFSK